STIASFAINIARYGLPEDYYSTYLQRLNALTVEDINAAAKKYIQPDHMHITIVGNGKEFKEKVTQFGEVKSYTNTGEEAKEIAVDADMTAESVIEKYIEAIGGEEKAAAIQSAVIKQSSEIQGQQMAITTTHDLAAMKFEQEVSMMGQVMQKITMENGKATISAQGQSQTLTDEQYEEAKMGMFIFPELHYEEMGYSFSLDGIQDVEGVQAYKVTVTNPTGSAVTNYYQVDNGLKVRSESPTVGTVTYKKYDTVEGVKYP